MQEVVPQAIYDKQQSNQYDTSIRVFIQKRIADPGLEILMNTQLVESTSRIARVETTVRKVRLGLLEHF